MSIKSPDEWATLAELPCPIIQTESAKGTIYSVCRVVALAARHAECRNLQTNEVYSEGGRFFFPAVDVEVGKERLSYKLPLQLTNWAIDVVALALDGRLTFPMQVEFGVLAGRPYAEML